MSSRDRVQRHRANKAASGRIRVELYLDRNEIAALERYANDIEDTRPSALRSLVVTGLRVEQCLPIPGWFSDRVRKRFR